MRKADRVRRHILADGSVREYRYPAARSHPTRYAPDSVATLILDWRRSPEWQALAPASRATYGTYLRDLELLAHRPVTDIARRDVLAMRDAIAAARGNGAAGGFVRTASALFGWAVDRDRLTQSPVQRIKALPGGHLQAWTADQADEAQRLLPEALRRVVVLARYTGQRRTDLCRLAWSAYDGSSIRLRQQKTGAALVIPAHPILRAELDLWRAEAASPVILLSDRGRPWQPQHLSHQLPVALERIGLPPLGVHGLRKLAAASLAEAGCSTMEIAAITGHRTLAMVQLYVASAEQERLASAAIVRLTNASTRGRR